MGMFKAQAFDIFEELTIRHPDFDMGYYFLGYSYANMGQYTKAQITWQEFMELSRDRKEDGDSSMDPIPADEMQEMARRNRESPGIHGAGGGNRSQCGEPESCPGTSSMELTF